MVNRVSGRRSERQRKKALRRFSNKESDPLIVEDDVQDVVQEQVNEIDEQIILDNAHSQPEHEDEIEQ
ncbi:hypothetical protein L1887_34750 [Cichorium endivia]|nr:hypothetical protein L1887_34750 [Cichorium endivia]